MNVLSVSNNMLINELTEKEYAPLSIKRTFVKQKSLDSSKLLAIIDSGIDTTLFTWQIKNLIWSDKPGTPTLYNFLPRQPVSDFSDDGIIKHGSAVTALAINAMENSQSYPRLMILKALDKDDHGTTFTVSCALSYAIQNHATIVNASLGYLGKPDPLLEHYIRLCTIPKQNPIQLFFAAGNTPDPHDDKQICSKNNNTNLLTGSTLFYPACFSNQFANITSVTQVRVPDTSCYYQYYSPSYISLGVLNTKFCCSFEVDFRNNNVNYYEGSSFATPIASGTKMTTIINSSNTGLTNPIWNGLVKTAPQKLVTKDGSYIIY